METGLFKIIAKTFQGLEDVLAEEITNLGGKNVEIGRRMVSYDGDQELLYRSNLQLRTALKILKPIYNFTATDTDEVYKMVKEIPWEQYMTADSTFSIDAVVFSEEFRHSKFVTYRVKDAIADYFYDKEGKRPTVRLNNADLVLNIHIAETTCTLSLDSSGESLHKRGYRVAQTEAPINEVLAAGIILKTGWKGEKDFIDPMCGSGTFLVEAALIARNINPGIYRSGFGFERWKDYDADLYDKLYNDDSGEREFTHKIYGSDISERAIEIATQNVKSAGVLRDVELEVKSIQKYETVPAGGIVVTNPPYGERISSEDMEGLYEAIGNRLKHVFKDYEVWIIAQKNEYIDKIGLKPSFKMPILNGSLECELRQIMIFDSKYKEFKSEGGDIKEEKRAQRAERFGKFERNKSIKPAYGKHVEKDFKKGARPDKYKSYKHGVYDDDDAPSFGKGKVVKKFKHSDDDFSFDKKKRFDKKFDKFDKKSDRKFDKKSDRKFGDKFGDKFDKKFDDKFEGKRNFRDGDKPYKKPTRDFATGDDDNASDRSRGERLHGEEAFNKFVRFKKPTLAPKMRERKGGWKKQNNSEEE